MSGLTYETVSELVQQGGSLFFTAAFIVALAYAFWPRNRDTFKRAAHAALDDTPNDAPLHDETSHG